MLGWPSEWKDVGAIATSIGVLYALYRDLFLTWRNRPILEVRCEPNPPDFYVIGRNLDRKLNVLLYVKNVGKGRANQVQVIAEGLWSRPHENGPFREAALLPMPLRWAFENEPFGTEKTLIANGIAPGTGQHCRIGVLTFLDQQARLSMNLAMRGDGVTVHVEPAHYQLKLRIAAANAEAVVRYLEFRVTGKWSQDDNELYATAITDVWLRKELRT
ncbi:MAG: hypothetical protein ABI548_11885 [Polyangiaceae bacterium]